MLYNTYFLSLTASAKKLPDDLLSLLMQVLLLNSHLKEFITPGVGKRTRMNRRCPSAPNSTPPPLASQV
jgi:hypothetical protein